MIFSFIPDRNGCGFYRTLLPFGLLQTHYNLEHRSKTYWLSKPELTFARWIRFQRQATDEQLKVFREYKEAGKKTGLKMIYEIDDNVHELEPTNTLALKFYTPKRKDNVVAMMQEADMVTFSTNRLKKYYAEHFDIHHSVVVPNRIPRFMWSRMKQAPRRRKKPMILWYGGEAHANGNADFSFLVDHIKETRNKYTWSFIGAWPKDVEREPHVKLHEWVAFEDLPFTIWKQNPDVIICPIADNEFNKCKSDLKVMEASTLGIPIVASTFKGSPYNPHREIATLVKNNPDDWKQAINEAAKRGVTMEQRLKKIQKTFWMEDELMIFNPDYQWQVLKANEQIRKKNVK